MLSDRFCLRLTEVFLRPFGLNPFQLMPFGLKSFRLIPLSLRLMTFGQRPFFPRPNAVLSEDDRGFSETDF